MGHARLSLCEGKDGLTRQIAQKIAKRMSRKGSRANAYICRFCHEWVATYGPDTDYIAVTQDRLGETT